MSCLNLKFPPARKAWEIFTTKIRRKLQILQPPKKKSVYLHGCNSVPRRSFKRKQRSHVFVDELFRPALDATVLEHGLWAVQTKGKTLRSIKKMEKSTDAEAGMSRAFAEGGDLTTVAGDDMWESVAMASPLMRKIDERAEEFIARFRAEMVYQEMAAGDL